MVIMEPGGASGQVQEGPATDRATLDRSLLDGIVWTGATRWAAQILSWAGTLVVARVLSPSQFGLVGATNVFIGLVERVSELGLGAAVIRRRIRDPELVGQINSTSVLLGIAFALVSFGASWPLAAFLGKPEVREITGWMSLTFIITAFRVIPRAMLSLDLRFKRVAALDAAEAITSTVVIVALALGGAGVWSIVAGLLVGTVSSTILAVHAARPPFRWPTATKQLGDEIRYGLHIVGTRLAWYWYNQADFMVVGRFLSAAAFGFYSFAWQLASIPVQRISALVNQVSTPVFAQVYHQRAELARYFLLLTEGLAFVTLPFSAGLVLTAPELVVGVLSEKWAPTIVPLQILGLYGGMRTITNLFSNLLQTVGRAREVFVNTLIAAIVLPIGFVVGAITHGTTGVALVWVVGYPLVIIPQARLALEVTGVPFLAYVRAMRPAALATGIMAVAVFTVGEVRPASWHPLAALAIEVFVGVAVYAGIVWGLYGDRARKLVATFRGAQQTAKTTPEAAT